VLQVRYVLRLFVSRCLLVAARHAAIVAVTLNLVTEPVTKTRTNNKLRRLLNILVWSPLKGFIRKETRNPASTIPVRFRLRLNKASPVQRSAVRETK
jgi:hypothetical protein